VVLLSANLFFSFKGIYHICRLAVGDALHISFSSFAQPILLLLSPFLDPPLTLSQGTNQQRQTDKEQEHVFASEVRSTHKFVFVFRCISVEAIVAYYSILLFWVIGCQRIIKESITARRKTKGEALSPSDVLHNYQKKKKTGKKGSKRTPFSYIALQSNNIHPSPNHKQPVSARTHTQKAKTKVH
jgi:hypothetical protein